MKLPKEIREMFRRVGRQGGLKGGRRCLETMTPEQRSERARRAVQARERNRRARLSTPEEPA